MSGVPVGAELKAGGVTLTADSLGRYAVSLDKLSDLTITPPKDSDVDFDLTITAVSTETDGKDTASEMAKIKVVVNAVADAPTLTADSASVTVNEDETVALGKITAELTDTDKSEVLTAYISGVPTGAVLKADGVTLSADGQGHYAVDPAQLSKLTITPPANSDEDFTLTVAVTSTEKANSNAATVSKTVSVVVNPVPDAPTLSVLPASGSEDTAIDIGSRISASLTDPSETLSVSITGIPTGATLTSGSGSIAVNGGTAVVTAAQLAGLKITPPLNSDADFSLGVTALSSEPGVATPAASATQSLAVTVTAVADKPTLSVSDASGTANTPIVIGSLINAALTDNDGSESLSITLTGIPAGATLTNTAKDILTVSGGSITLSAQQLAGLAITPSNDVDFSLGVTAVSSEKNDLSTATSNTLAMNVVVNPAFTTDGNTSYQIAPNGGSLLINDTGGGQDTLTVTTAVGTVFSALNFERVGNNLVLSMSAGGGSATVTIQNHFAGSPVESLQFSNGGSVYGYSLGTSGYKISSDLSGTGNEDVIASSSLAESPSGGNGNDLVFGNGGADTMSGGNGNDLLVGGDGNDRIDGGDDNDVLVGGTGNDVLIGGAGNDVFVFNEFGASNADTVQGFDANGVDRIRLSASVFAGVSGPGTLSSADFAAVNGTGATATVNAGVNIIYDSSSGALYYDPNGGDGGGRVLFATLVGVSGTFDQSDIIVG